MMDDCSTFARPTFLPLQQTHTHADLSSKILNAANVFATCIDNNVFDKIYSLVK